MRHRSCTATGIAFIGLLLASGQSLAFEDVRIAPTITAKNYLQLQASYTNYERDQDLRATGEKWASSKSETNHVGIQGFMTVNDRFDLRTTFYRSESHYRSNWPGHESDETNVDPSIFSAQARFKFFSNEAGGLVGIVSGSRKDGDSNGYGVEVAPYFNLSPVLVAQVYAGFASSKSGSSTSHQESEHVTPVLHWKATPNLLLSPFVSYTHYDSRGVHSSYHTKSIGLESRYDIDPKWSIVPSIEYERFSERHNNYYVNESGTGRAYSFFLGIRRHLD